MGGKGQGSEFCQLPDPDVPATGAGQVPGGADVLSAPDGQADALVVLPDSEVDPEWVARQQYLYLGNLLRARIFPGS